MNDQELKNMLDKAEEMGFKRGVQTFAVQIFQAIEKAGMMAISYGALKLIYRDLMDK